MRRIQKSIRTSWKEDSVNVECYLWKFRKLYARIIYPLETRTDTEIDEDDLIGEETESEFIEGETETEKDILPGWIENIWHHWLRRHCCNLIIQRRGRIAAWHNLNGMKSKFWKSMSGQTKTCASTHENMSVQTKHIKTHQNALLWVPVALYEYQDDAGQ